MAHKRLPLAHHRRSAAHFLGHVSSQRELAEEPLAVAQAKGGLRTLLFVPMLRNDELIGSLAFGRQRVEPFTEKEIEPDHRLCC